MSVTTGDFFDLWLPCVVLSVVGCEVVVVVVSRGRRENMLRIPILMSCCWVVLEVKLEWENKAGKVSWTIQIRNNEKAAKNS